MSVCQVIGERTPHVDDSIRALLKHHSFRQALADKRTLSMCHANHDRFRNFQVEAKHHNCNTQPAIAGRFDVILFCQDYRANRASDILPSPENCDVISVCTVPPLKEYKLLVEEKENFSKNCVAPLYLREHTTIWFVLPSPSSFVQRVLFHTSGIRKVKWVKKDAFLQWSADAVKQNLALVIEEDAAGPIFIQL